MEEVKLGTNRSFGFVFAVVFCIVALYPLLNQESIRLWSLIVSIIFFILGLMDSKVLLPFNKIWFKFGLFLGKLVSPIIMSIIFFLVVTPIAVLMRLLKKDLLNLKFNTNNSYWIKKDELQSNMKNQF